MNIANTPATPYYAVIFTSLKNAEVDGYDAMAAAMAALAQQQAGFLGVESARDQLGITVSYWDSLEAIAAWKQQCAHLIAQQRGRDDWYAAYQVRICKVEREYGFERPSAGS